MGEYFPDRKKKHYSIRKFRCYLDSENPNKNDISDCRWISTNFHLRKFGLHEVSFLIKIKSPAKLFHTKTKTKTGSGTGTATLHNWNLSHNKSNTEGKEKKRRKKKSRNSLNYNFVNVSHGHNCIFWAL